MKKNKNEEDISSKTESAESFYQPFQPSPIVCPFTQQIRIPSLTKSKNSSSIPNVVESVYFLAIDADKNKEIQQSQNHQHLTTKNNEESTINYLNNINSPLTHRHIRTIHPPISPPPNQPKDHNYVDKNGNAVIYNEEYIGTSQNSDGITRNLDSHPSTSQYWKSNSFFSREPYDFLRGSVFQQCNRYPNQDYYPLREQMSHLNLDRNPEFNTPNNISHHENRFPVVRETQNDSALYVTDMLSTMGKQCLHFFVDHVSWLSKKRCPKRCRVYVIPEVRTKVDELFKTNFRWTKISIHSMWSTRQNNCKEIMHRHKHNSRHVIRNLIISCAPTNAF